MMNNLYYGCERTSFYSQVVIKAALLRQLPRRLVQRTGVWCFHAQCAESLSMKKTLNRYIMIQNAVYTINAFLHAYNITRRQDTSKWTFPAASQTSFFL